MKERESNPVTPADVSGPACRTRGALAAQQGITFGGTSTREIEEDDTSSHDDVGDEDYRVEHKPGKGPAIAGDDDEDGENDDDEEDEKENDHGGAQAPEATYAHEVLRLRVPGGLYRLKANYNGRGMTDTVRDQRRQNPKIAPTSASAQIIGSIISSNRTSMNQ